MGKKSKIKSNADRRIEHWKEKNERAVADLEYANAQIDGWKKKFEEKVEDSKTLHNELRLLREQYDNDVAIKRALEIAASRYEGEARVLREVLMKFQLNAFLAPVRTAPVEDAEPAQRRGNQ